MYILDISLYYINKLTLFYNIIKYDLVVLGSYIYTFRNLLS
jgi:hypothetical protein